MAITHADSKTDNIPPNIVREVDEIGRIRESR